VDWDDHYYCTICNELVPAIEIDALRSIAQAARAFLSQPYDNGQHEARLKMALAALPQSGEGKP
jgi:hypothetical protein